MRQRTATPSSSPTCADQCAQCPIGCQCTASRFVGMLPCNTGKKEKELDIDQNITHYNPNFLLIRIASLTAASASGLRLCFQARRSMCTWPCVVPCAVLHAPQNNKITRSHLSLTTPSPKPSGSRQQQERPQLLLLHAATAYNRRSCSRQAM